jgi:sigma-B regulation protein RsbU (phosphoserine phosphatase)
MPRILIVGDPPPPDTRATFEAAGFPVTTGTSGRLQPVEFAEAQLVVFDVGPINASSAQALCRRWRIELGEQYTPIIWLLPDQTSASTADALDAGADVCLARSIAPAQLLAQARALLRVQHMNARLGARAAEAQQINHRLQQAYQQMDSDLEMTRRIHRGFLPRTLPEIHQARFAVCYRPRSRIGGDFYDVQRLDEEHAGFYVADAMGRGLPATSLLTIFVKKSMRIKEISGRSYRLVPPSEVLAGLNRDVVALGLPDPPFVTMLYAQLNCRDGALTFARAGHPPPLHVPENGNLQYWSATGTLLGVFEADYPQQTKQLRPRDKVLFVSDGVNPSMPGETGASFDPLLEAATKYRAEPLTSFVDNVSRELLLLSRGSEDFTMLGVEYH